MKQRDINSVGDYISAIEELKTYYPSGIFPDSPVAKLFLYRGHCDENYELLPGVFRKTIETTTQNPIENKKYLAWTDEMGLLKSKCLITTRLDKPSRM